MKYLLLIILVIPYFVNAQDTNSYMLSSNILLYTNNKFVKWNDQKFHLKVSKLNDNDIFIIHNIFQQYDKFINTKFENINSCEDFIYSIDSTGNWWIYIEKNKYQFYNAISKKINQSYYKECNRNIEVIDTKNINGYLFYLLHFTVPNKILRDYPTFWFSNEFGIVAIGDGKSFFMYYREDFINTFISQNFSK